MGTALHNVLEMAVFAQQHPDGCICTSWNQPGGPDRTDYFEHAKCSYDSVVDLNPQGNEMDWPCWGYTAKEVELQQLGGMCFSCGNHF